MTKIILCPGVGDKSMLFGVTGHLPGAHVVSLPSRTYGPVPLPFGDDFETSVAEGERLLTAELNKEPAVVLGFSAGAAVAGNVAARGHKNLIGTGLVADPFQPRRITAFVNRSYGIAGSRDVFGSELDAPVKWVCDPRDVICQCDENSPLRTIADQTARMSLKRPDYWASDLLGRITRQRWQRVIFDWRNPADVRDQYRRAADDAWGYLPGGRGDHVGYGVRREGNGRTYLHNLAEWVKSL